MTSGIDILQEVLRECLEEKEARMVKANKAQPMTRQTEAGLEKWCSKCEAYRPADLDHFYQDNRSKTKLSSWCRKCQRASVGSSNKQSKPVKGNGDNTLVLDFSNADMLLADLQAEAVTDFRSTEMQALYLISKGLLKEANQNGRP